MCLHCPLTPYHLVQMPSELGHVIFQQGDPVSHADAVESVLRRLAKGLLAVFEACLGILLGVPPFISLALFQCFRLSAVWWLFVMEEAPGAGHVFLGPVSLVG